MITITNSDNVITHQSKNLRASQPTATATYAVASAVFLLDLFLWRY